MNGQLTESSLNYTASYLNFFAPILVISKEPTKLKES